MYGVRIRLYGKDFVQVLEFANTFLDETEMIEDQEELSWVERLRNGKVLSDGVAMQSGKKEGAWEFI